MSKSINQNINTQINEISKKFCNFKTTILLIQLKKYLKIKIN